jgi:hypothetical protein
MRRRKAKQRSRSGPTKTDQQQQSSFFSTVESRRIPFPTKLSARNRSPDGKSTLTLLFVLIRTHSPPSKSATTPRAVTPTLAGHSNSSLDNRRKQLESDPDSTPSREILQRRDTQPWKENTS